MKENYEDDLTLVWNLLRNFIKSKAYHLINIAIAMYLDLAYAVISGVQDRGEKGNRSTRRVKFNSDFSS
ncbi:hypothetical protein [Nostoc sp. FACHB-145]|uniref:hypothetical protein n=1 Tax=Nostoc sp. FACHB-145 TaxID=2692836 RepID=UPI001683AE97|nr:hypothetical protein [Nostoc sp. FACHB-145]MBD2472016.1 hypothetical protein [Nostoc sp. FACHB-145]